MLDRVLEPEVMDTADEARDYDSMDHSQVNRAFAADFLAASPILNPILDVGTGTAQIPIKLCRQCPHAKTVAIDLADHMLALARANVERAGLASRIAIEKADAKRFANSDGRFTRSSPIAPSITFQSHSFASQRCIASARKAEHCSFAICCSRVTWKHSTGSSMTMRRTRMTISVECSAIRFMPLSRFPKCAH
jgi:SAM-dependent methyltransferase